jgi:two-component system capsular synthesis response regulator RcsB
MAPMQIKLALADDHPTVIAGIQHELARNPTFNVIGVARNSSEIVELLSRSPCDILISDYVMPGGEYGDGITMLSFLRTRYPPIKDHSLHVGQWERHGGHNVETRRSFCPKQGR